MWIGSVCVDSNGIVLFDPDALASWRSHIEEGADLFREFTSTNVGDDVLARGLFVPLLAIDDGGYDVVVRSESEDATSPGVVVVSNGEFALRVESGLVVADLAVLRHWMTGVGWVRVPAEPGDYAVTINGFRSMSSDGKVLEAAGYEFVLTRRKELPTVTGSVGRNMRVMNWWDT